MDSVFDNADIIEMAPSAIGVLPRENEDREEFPENKGASGMPLLQSMEQLCEVIVYVTLFGNHCIFCKLLNYLL